MQGEPHLYYSAPIVGGWCQPVRIGRSVFGIRSIRVPRLSYCEGTRRACSTFGFSRDGRWVITGAYDGTARLWRLKLGDLVGVACQTGGSDFSRRRACASALCSLEWSCNTSELTLEKLDGATTTKI